MVKQTPSKGKGRAAAQRTKTRALNAGIWCPAGASDRPRPLEPQAEFGGGLRPESGIRRERLVEDAGELGGEIGAQQPDID